MLRASSGDHPTEFSLQNTLKELSPFTLRRQDSKKFPCEKPHSLQTSLDPSDKIVCYEELYHK